MKKIILSTVLLVCFSSLKSQISNFSELLSYYEMSLDAFNSNLSKKNNWVSMPVTHNNVGIRSTEKHHFAFRNSEEVQILGKSITYNQATDNVVESTFLLFDKSSLLGKLKSDLKKYGYISEFSGDEVLLFSKNKTIVKIQLQSLKENPIPDGAYEIVIVNAE
ncbi:MAG: hypothetical protein GX159_11240 [Flavobacteriaceae bacterium]|jgi:hypothetical protein|nr:hypothetical protein [Flavobacteriaceae bacterium]